MEIIVNFKTYKQGKDALDLARVIQKFNSKVIVAVEATDINLIKNKTKLKVYSQHVDDISKGKNTGFILPEAVKKAGAVGTILNHSEHKISNKEIKEIIDKCKKLNLKVVCCVPNLKEAKKIKKFKPYAIAFEDPKLIGTGKPVTEYKPEEIIKFVKLLNDTNILPICGAGISSKKDIITAKNLGCKGVLIASAITNSNKTKIKEM